ncbi:MAG: VWA domain-containing protein, partial [Patescibacteria group bacterium]
MLRKSSAGLTLLEVLITVLIGSIILTAIYLLVGRGFTISREVTEQNRITEDARINTRRLARLIQHASATDGKTWLTASSPFELAFTAQLDDDPELEHVRIFLEGTLLRQTITQLDSNGNPTGESHTETLAASVRNGETNQAIFSLQKPTLLPYPTLTDITLVIDVDPNTRPPAATIQTAVTPRNLARQYAVPQPPGATPPPEEAPPCISEEPYDFVLTMDASASISRKEFKQMRDFAKRLATSLLTSTQPSRFGLVTFGSEGEGRVALPITNNLEQALTTIDKLPNPSRRSNTDIQEGIELAHNELKGSRRPDVRPVMVVLTDGAHNQPGDPIEQARLALQDGVDIFVVTVGLEKRIEDEFREALSQLGLLDHLFPIEDFEGLVDALNKLYQALCPGSPTPLPVPSASPTPTPEDCEAIRLSGLEGMLVLDSSGSISGEDYEKVREFAQAFANSVITANPESRVGAAIFSGQGMGKVPLPLTNDLPHARAVLRRLAHIKFSTDIEEGLTLRHVDLKYRGRSGVPKYMILATDGRHNQPGDPYVAAQDAKNDGITIFVIAIKLRPEEAELVKPLASKPEYAIALEDFDELIAGLDEINSFLCLPPPEQGTPTPPPPAPGPTPPPPADLIGIVSEANRRRAPSQLPPFAVNAKLNAAAQAKLDHMIEKQYLDHLGPDGKGPDDFLREAGYSWTARAENLAWTTSDNWLSEFFKFWMNSPTHRAIIFSPNYTESGAAVGRGTINGRQHWIGVQLFGKTKL